MNLITNLDWATITTSFGCGMLTMLCLFAGLLKPALAEPTPTTTPLDLKAAAERISAEAAGAPAFVAIVAVGRHGPAVRFGQSGLPEDATYSTAARLSASVAPVRQAVH